MPRDLLVGGALLGLLALGGCAAAPQPFAGHPGALGVRLAAAPPARLDVMAPTPDVMAPRAGAELATAVAPALVAAEVPAVAQPARSGDWRLVIGAEPGAVGVVPRFSVLDPAGATQGEVRGAPVAAAAWQAGAPATLTAAAGDAAPKIAELLTSIDAARKQSDPNSLYNRPARVAVLGVRGAPGDGNNALALQLRRQLHALGEQVQEGAEGADFTVAGEVRTGTTTDGSERVEIQWAVNDAAGHDLGRVIQVNDVPAGSIGPHWGDVALAVAQQAAAGIKDMILKQTGGRTPPDPAKVP